MCLRCPGLELLRPGLLLAAAVFVWVASVPTAAAPPLRVCADPNNLPFSNQHEQGFENALAESVAQWLGRDGVEYTWRPQRRGFVRNTLNAGECDVLMSVPTGYERAWTTRPYYRSSYVWVYREDSPHKLHSLDDPRLSSLRIGVHVVGDDYSNTPGAAALGRRGLINNIVGYSIYGDYSEPNPPARLIEAVAAGDVDAAIAWGPLAGYFAARQPARLVMVPVTPERDGQRIPFSFDIAMATRRGDPVLHGELNELIERRSADMRQLLARYGVPAAPPEPTRNPEDLP